MSKTTRGLKAACVTMVKLLSGCNTLRLYSDFSIDHKLRICNTCDSGNIEDVYHIVMECQAYLDSRGDLFRDIENTVIEQVLHLFSSLSDQMRFYILMGLENPIIELALSVMRKTSAYNINKIYNKGNALCKKY